MQRKAFIYCRISDDKTGAKLGVQRQEEDCRALAREKGYEVVRVFQDNDISAYSGKARPEYKAMLARVMAGEVDAVLCWHPDRLHRSMVELETYIDVCREGKATTHCVKTGEMDLATDAGQLIARMLGAAAKYESDMKATRIRRASEQAIRAGKWTGGTRPFGWTIKDGVPALHPEESAALADAFARVLRGDSLGSIIREMNGQGLTTTHGKPWGYAQLSQALKRPRNAGLSSYHGEIVGDSTFPAIVSENVWRGVCAVLSDPSRRRSQSNKAVHLLAGIAQCHCGGYVRTAGVTGRDGTRHTIYRCVVKGPGHVSKRVAFVDDVVNTVIVAVRAAEARMDNTPAGADPEAERLQLEAMALRKRQEEAGVQAALGEIPMHMLGTVNAVIEKQLETITAAMISLEEAARRKPPAEEDLRPVSMDSPEAAEWLSMHIDDRKDYLRRMCNVVLLPHGKSSTKVFDPETVQVVTKAPGEASGPLDQRVIERLKARRENFRGVGAGFFASFYEDGREVTYRLGETIDDMPTSNRELIERMTFLNSIGVPIREQEATDALLRP